MDLVLGLVSLVIPVPRNERDSVRAGGIFLGVETRHAEKLSPGMRALMILGGASMMIAGKVRNRRSCRVRAVLMEAGLHPETGPGKLASEVLAPPSN